MENLADYKLDLENHLKLIFFRSCFKTLLYMILKAFCCCSCCFLFIFLKVLRACKIMLLNFCFCCFYCQVFEYRGCVLVILSCCFFLENDLPMFCRSFLVSFC